MTSIKQVEANRRNAKKSTGPKTSSGKAISSQNAIGAGIFSKNPLLAQESPEEFEQFSQGILQAYPPFDGISASYAERIILGMWRKRRLQIAETAKLQLATRDESVIHEVNIMMKRSVLSPLGPKDISIKQEEYFQALKQLDSDMELVAGKRIDRELTILQEISPKIHKLLNDQLDKKYDADARKNLSGDELSNELTMLMSQIQAKIFEDTPKHEAYTLSLMIKAERAMLPEKDFNLFSKYDNQINNEINRAIEGYKKHCEWIKRTIEIESVAI